MELVGASESAAKELGSEDGALVGDNEASGLGSSSIS